MASTAAAPAHAADPASAASPPAPALKTQEKGSEAQPQSGSGRPAAASESSDTVGGPVKQEGRVASSAELKAAPDAAPVSVKLEATSGTEPEHVREERAPTEAPARGRDPNEGGPDVVQGGTKRAAERAEGVESLEGAAETENIPDAKRSRSSSGL